MTALFALPLRRARFTIPAAEGEVTLFYKVGVSISQWRTYFCVTRDGGKSWSYPRELVEGEDGGGGRGPVKNKCFLHSSGALLAPASDERGIWRSFIDRFDGEKWEKCPIPVSEENKRVHMIQPTLWESENGDVHALMRTLNSYVYRSDSKDGGKSWCEAYKTDIPSNNSGIDCVKADNGAIFLVCNPIPPHQVRSPLSVLVSTDDGATFEKVLDLEGEKREFSYPAIVSRGNKLFVTYTYARTNIAYAEIEL